MAVIPRLYVNRKNKFVRVENKCHFQKTAAVLCRGSSRLPVPAPFHSGFRLFVLFLLQVVTMLRKFSQFLSIPTPLGILLPVPSSPTSRSTSTPFSPGIPNPPPLRVISIDGRQKKSAPLSTPFRKMTYAFSWIEVVNERFIQTVGYSAQTSFLLRTTELSPSVTALNLLKYEMTGVHENSAMLKCDSRSHPQL